MVSAGIEPVTAQEPALLLSCSTAKALLPQFENSPRLAYHLIRFRRRTTLRACFDSSNSFAYAKQFFPSHWMSELAK